MHPTTLRTLVLLCAAASATAQVDPRGRSILFIRGADASGGATEGGTAAQRTEQLGDINNTSTARGNHGYASLAATLRADGFTVTQLVESSTALTLATLTPHRVVVMGSNNKVYSASEVQAFHDYVDKGGSALFISDANWGLTWGAAPSSDNQFLTRYGAEVYQDSGQLPRMSRSTNGRYLIADHPALSGPDGLGTADNVDDYDGEGINLFRITKGTGGYQAIPVVSALGLFKRTNTQTGSQGTLQPATATDAAMFCVEKGASRILGHFDRNTFFNLNGAGTDLFQRDNQQLARNVFRFLASVRASRTPLGSGCGAASAAPTLDASEPVLGRPLTFVLSGAAANANGLVAFAPGTPSPFAFPNGCITYPDLANLAPLVGLATDGSGRWQWSATLPASLGLSGFRSTAQAVTFVASGPFLGTGELSNAVDLVLGYPR